MRFPTTGIRTSKGHLYAAKPDGARGDDNSTYISFQVSRIVLLWQSAFAENS
jgi:hypothetical protein